MALENKLKDVVESLDYDFNEFELTHFIRHIEQLMRREIILVPLPLELGLYAVWIPAETAHYVFYNEIAHPVDQTHSILHELAHIVLNHSRKHIGQLLPRYNSSCYP